MRAHEWKVGDKATVAHGHVTTIVRVGKRVRTADGKEWHVPSYSSQWREWGGYATLFPYSDGDEERVRVGDLEQERARFEQQAQRWEDLALEQDAAEKYARERAAKLRADAESSRADRDRIDGEIAALKAKIAEMGR